MARTGLIFGGKSAEHLVSVRSARAVSAALLAGGHEVVPIGIDEHGVVAPLNVAAEVLASDAVQVPQQKGALGASFAHVLSALPLDVVFPIVHGTFGEDGTMQGLLAMLDLPCVGADTMTSAVCMDKAMCKRALSAAGLDVVEWVLVDGTTSAENIVAHAKTLSAPWFVKPSVGGSSVGCKKANTEAELHAAVAFALRFDDEVIIERCVVGRELEVAVLGARGDLSSSVIGEIIPGAEFYDYKDKYLDDKAGLIAPAPLPPSLEKTMRATATKAFAALGGVGMARVDFFLEDGEDGAARMMVNEINTLPGFTEISMYPRLWSLTGKPMPALCTALVDIAMAEHRRQAAYHDEIGRFISQIG